MNPKPIIVVHRNNGKEGLTMMDTIGRFKLAGWRLILALTPICLMAFPLRAHAYIVPRHSLPEMIAVSDLIAVGRIVDVRDGWPDQRKVFAWTVDLGMRNGQSARLPKPTGRFDQPVAVMMRVADIQVEQVVKGRGYAVSGLVPFQFPQQAPSQDRFGGGVWFQDYKDGERWLVFLRRGERGLEPINPINPLSEQDVKIPDDLVLPEELVGEPTEKLEQLLLWFVAHGDDEFILKCLKWVEYPSMWIAPETAEGMAFLLQNKNADIRLRAATALCHAKYAPAIPVLVADWDTRSKDDSLRRYSLEEMRWCVTEDALPYLYPLLDHPDAEIRRAAGHVLRTVAHPSSAPYLVKALDDPDLEVRYYAAYGLAAIAGETSLRVGMSDFEGDEAKYIEHWKRWWKEGGAEKIHEQPGAAVIPVAVRDWLKEGEEETPLVPPPVEEKISRDDAVAQARAYLLSLGIQVDGLAGLRKEPVEPYQQPKPGFAHCGEPARLAWEVVFFLNESEGPMWIAIAYVDIEDGSLIGWGGSPEVEALRAGH